MYIEVDQVRTILLYPVTAVGNVSKWSEDIINQCKVLYVTTTYLTTRFNVTESWLSAISLAST